MNVSHSVVSDSLQPMDCNPSGSSVHGDSPGKNTGVRNHTSIGDLPDQGIGPRSPALQEDSLPSEPLGKSIGICKLIRISFWVASLSR